MPELPEVETTRCGIAPHLEGREVKSVTVRNPHLRRPVPEKLKHELPGRRIDAVIRRGKYLLIRAGDASLVIHLGMSGSLRLVPPDTPPRKHDHVDIQFSDQILRYHDPRRFGLVDWWPGDGSDHPLVASLGIEPLSPEFDGAWLFATTRGRRGAIKLLLMDAHMIVGVGNIYASESLFRAGIRPGTAAGRLSRARCGRLAEAIKTTLNDAIRAGGTTLKDFVNGHGEPGYFQNEVYVYGRTDQACRVCGSTIRQKILGQRNTFWCPHCQT
ncbi:MAG: bifunctional DNA-formamidopyrimidine glycosylase/DNA-(apurinic or apyrimidinic site) lyase [Betaproteobacteria bacterium]|nr:bifunctional DNA-formamidopyrimidine glycosylase/DNA-(apurinic or apyrimidinic site) lyase [Betaproteobacteria bacterium]